MITETFLAASIRIRYNFFTMRHQNMFRTFFIITVFVVIIAIIGISLAIHIYVLPKLKRSLITACESQTNKKLSIDRLSYRFPNSLSVHSITLSEQDDRPIIHIRQLTTRIALGDLLQKKAINLTFTIHPDNALLSEVTGTVYYAQGSKRLQLSIKTDYDTIPLAIETTIEDINAISAIPLTFTSENLSLTGTINRLDTYTISYDITGTCSTTTAHLNGTFTLKSQPFIDAQLALTGSLADITKNRLLQKILPLPSALRGGMFDLTTSIKGNPARPQSYDLSGSIITRNVSIDTISIAESVIQYTLYQGHGKLYNTTFKLYDGIITMNGTIYITTPQPNYQATVNWNTINMHRLVQDLAVKYKDASGSLSGALSITGTNFRTSTLRGTGWLQVTNGTLWELPLLKGIPNLLNITGLGNITFHEASGMFAIHSDRVFTENLTLASNDINVFARGSIGFDDTIDLHLSATTPQQEMTKIGSLNDLKKVFFQGAAQFIPDIKITGTFKDPTYEVIRMPQKTLQGIIDVFEGIRR